METPDATERSSRTAAILVAAFIVVVLVVVVVFKVGGSSDHQVAWTIVESADEGHTLRIVPLVASTPCARTPKVDLRKSNANRVDLAVSVEDRDCEDAGADAARAPGPIDVKLQQPLRGQEITGPQEAAPSAWPGAKASNRMPSVVGFRLPDAKAILAARGLDVDGVVGPTADATEVTAQSPPAGPHGGSEGYRPRVHLRTVPR